MKRLLFTSSNQCPFNCYYCFSKFSQYDSEKLPDISQKNYNKDQKIINYPACDYDLFALENPFEILENLADIKGSISISTKAVLTNEMLNNLKIFNGKFKNSNSIFKIGISITSKFSLPEDEPNAAEYEDRIENAKNLNKIGIPTALVLKPLLKKIPIEEYRTIIKDFSEHIQAVLVGHEYIEDSLASKNDKTFLTSRSVSWLPKKPIWPCYDMSHYIHVLENYCRSIDLPCFGSDKEMMNYLINDNEIKMSV